MADVAHALDPGDTMITEQIVDWIQLVDGISLLLALVIAGWLALPEFHDG